MKRASMAESKLLAMAGQTGHPLNPSGRNGPCFRWWRLQWIPL